MFCDVKNMCASSPLTLFLDINGVLTHAPRRDELFGKLTELFPNSENYYDSKACDIAASHFFDKIAIASLNKIISGLEKMRRVSIVMSSSWRLNRSVNELKNEILGIHHFAKYIVDKTPNRVSSEETKKYCDGYYCRAAEIHAWLKQHPEVTDFLVIDDMDSELSTNFGDRYVEVDFRSLLTDEIANDILLKHGNQESCFDIMR